MELLSSDNDDDYKPLLPIKKGLQILSPPKSYLVDRYGVVSIESMESPCLFVSVVEVSSTPSTQTQCLASTFLGDRSLVICIHDLIIALRNKQNSKSEFRVADLGSFFYKYVKYLLSLFNENKIFELPFIHAPRTSCKGRLEGMDR